MDTSRFRSASFHFGTLTYSRPLPTFLIVGILINGQETFREPGRVTFEKGGKESWKDWKNQDFVGSYQVLKNVNLSLGSILLYST
jgi:hypothetical protein